MRRTLHHKRNHPQTQRVCTQQSTPRGKHTANHPATDAPQVIAHRGFKRKYPENSLSAFKGAVEADSNAIELDLALSKDDVVVISHVRQLGIYISTVYSVLTRTGRIAETLLRGEQASRQVRLRVPENRDHDPRTTRAGSTVIRTTPISGTTGGGAYLGFS